MTNPKLKGYVEVNTVNSSLNNEYDFGIHAVGCSDLRRGRNLGCQKYAHYAFSAQELVDLLRDDLAGDFGDSAEGFTFKIFPCAVAEAPTDKEE
jgi:hypothetical protein